MGIGPIGKLSSLGAATVLLCWPRTGSGQERRLRFAPQVRLPVEFSLEKQAETLTPRIYLNQVASCNGSSSICDEIYGVDLGESPAPGQSKVVAKGHIERVLQAEWPDHEIKVLGPVTLKVTAVAQVITKAQVRAALVDRLEVLAAEHEDLRIRLRSLQMSGEIKTRPGKVSLEFPDLENLQGASVDRLVKLDGLQNFELVCRRLEDAAVFGTGVRRSHRLAATISVERRLPVAARNLERGTLLSQKSVRLDWVAVRSTQNRVVATPANLYGRQVRQAMRVGEPFHANQIELPALVKRGQLVKLVLKSGAMNITGRVKALDSGGRGDIIKALYPSTGKKLSVRIIAGGTVEFLPF